MKVKSKFALLTAIVLMGIGFLLAGAQRVNAQGRAIGRVMFKNDQGQWVEYKGDNITRKEENGKTVLVISNPVERVMSVPPVDVGDLRQECGGGPAFICGNRTVISNTEEFTVIECDLSPNHTCVMLGLVGGHGGPGEK